MHGSNDKGKGVFLKKYVSPILKFVFIDFWRRFLNYLTLLSMMQAREQSLLLFKTLEGVSARTFSSPSPSIFGEFGFWYRTIQEIGSLFFSFTSPQKRMMKDEEETVSLLTFFPPSLLPPIKVFLRTNIVSVPRQFRTLFLKTVFP